ncbi:cold-shock protein [Mesorhizobium sp. IMUNJ 23232]|uniref:cold-shock protein n=1 Tax=Mesorhizobium sp. IMUNJ 23232 TaxID=3376064 RepID=UPI0037AB478F
MGKYRDHRERRGKRHGNDHSRFPDEGAEPSYFQVPPRETSDPVDAEVLWFRADKGFGFIKLSEGTEAYLHIRVLEAAGGHDLSTGAHLKVVVKEGARGRQVAKVLDIGLPSPETAPVERHETGAPKDPAPSEGRGMVKWYSPEKGFGFIAPENGEADIFVHATALTRSGLTVLEEGQTVWFQSGQGKKGMEVRTIRLA